MSNIEPMSGSGEAYMAEVKLHTRLARVAAERRFGVYATGRQMMMTRDSMDKKRRTVIQQQDNAPEEFEGEQDD